MQLNEVQTPLREDIESLLDQLVGKTMNVNIIIRISEKNVSTLYKLVNYFIGKGWPFHANFQCILEPEPSIGCIFGYWYPNPNILKAIFQEYIAHPQTEFCSLEKLIGVKEIHKIIWAGSPPIPNLTFCEAMNGLMVFTGDKMIHCPFETLEKQDEWNSGYNEYTSCKLAFTECPFNLSCGGGCRLISKDNRCPPVRDLLEISIEYYFDEFLKRMNFYDKYQGSP
jgi:sulfatase maturation enzyme AslB (radical SAM superfamily)